MLIHASSVAELNRLLLPSFCCLGRMTDWIQKSPLVKESGFHNTGNFGLWNPESWENFVLWSRNPGLWNPEYSSRYPQSHYWLESRKTHWQRLESNTWNPESTACNLESETLGDSIKGTQRQFSENICSEDDLRSRIFGTFVVKFLACLPLLGFSNF